MRSIPSARLWFRAKIIELVALMLKEPEKELFCQRLHRLTSDRVLRVKAILARDLAPPSLAERVASLSICASAPGH